MKPPHEDVEFRMPVWQALGEFFLDNEPNLEYVARVCAESPYSLGELDQILFNEVWPALSPNLASMAGEWAGWDREWLTKRVLEKYKTGSSRVWWLNPAKLFFCSAWFSVRKEIEQRRTRENPAL
ncbi:hypothetical protein SAMN05660284_02498 [Formivibrio citricus]|uniref:DUF7079 domain-containing protein n=2 Tax=Formivibrio citricus TaxID=83765 RepID=A0A1I5CVW1_9NEIS|nr:hypothetical protein SAMN05660284_02498 [Formivibrio citricus]